MAKDAVVTYRLYRRLRRLLQDALEAGDRAWGYVSDAWLAEQVRRWGPATHHIQLKASIVLKAITAAGLHLDLDRREVLLQHLTEAAEAHRTMLHQHGHIPNEKGSNKSLQAILKRLERRHSGRSFPRTATGQYATSKDALAELAEVEPFVRTLLDYRQVEKLRASFLDKMSKKVIHPSFDVLKVTGRTSSFGDLNAQNLPRDDRVRECFVPQPGHVLVIADYSAIEMVTLAQAVQSQFGHESSLAAALNEGRDPHVMVAAMATGKPEAEVSKAERQKAKPINFGKPGGMGDQTLKAYAKASYGVELTEEEVHDLSEAWFELYPEMRKFLAPEKDLRLELARFLGLTPQGHFEFTDSPKFLPRFGDDREADKPSEILGGMCLKVLGRVDPETTAGKPYDPDTVDYYWSRIEAVLGERAGGYTEAIQRRQPSAALRKWVCSQVDREPVWSLTGRLRARATFSARHNNVFQSLAADGAKLALWKVWRAGYRIVNFVHDELVVEIPDGADLTAAAEEIRELMIAGMRAVVPDVRVEVEYAAATAWSKSAQKRIDEQGRLVPWSPTDPDPPAPTPRNRKRRALGSLEAARERVAARLRTVSSHPKTS